MAIGRPTLYKPEYCEQLVEHMASGLSFESFAGRIGTNRDTLYNWTHAHPEFYDAKKNGMEQGLLFWEEKGREALDKEKFQASVYIFTMKARFQWADNLTIKNGKEVDEREKIKRLSTAELKKLIEENEKALAEQNIKAIEGEVVKNVQEAFTQVPSEDSGPQFSFDTH